jgi:hypothetical protein
MLDDGRYVEGVIFVKEVYQRWVDSRWGSEGVGHGGRFRNYCNLQVKREWSGWRDVE